MTGALTVVGQNGYYWSSSPSAAGNANGGSLSFSPEDINPLHGLQRARGFTVRCVQHLQAAFFCFLPNALNARRNFSRPAGSTTFGPSDLPRSLTPLYSNSQPYHFRHLVVYAACFFVFAVASLPLSRYFHSFTSTRTASALAPISSSSRLFGFSRSPQLL
ncbi:MAG: hypothetical protein NC209_02710, partial [Alistipes sp.]|nr:hypothetical protein [Alistipes sp.]